MNFLIVVLIFYSGPSFAQKKANNTQALMTEDGQYLASEEGERLLIEDGRRLSLEAFASSKKGSVKYETNKKAATMYIPGQGDVSLIKNQSGTWSPVGLAANSSLFNVWEVMVSISNSLKNAKVSLEGCGREFETNSEGNGRGLFYVDAVPADRSLTVVETTNNSISSKLEIKKKSHVKCKGKKKLKCDFQS